MAGHSAAPEPVASPEPTPVLDEAWSRRMALRRARRPDAHHRRHRPRLLVPPCLLREVQGVQRLGDWEDFLVDFQHHWPTDALNTYVSFIRDDNAGLGAKRTGNRGWFRLTEQWTPAAKSVFGFGVQGEVATSTHAGLPWLLYLRKHCKRPLHFWPFDGWEIPPGSSAVVEVYPSLWTRRFPKDGRDGDQQAAYVAAAWLQRADLSGSLSSFLKPTLTPDELEITRVEGWILGVA